MANLRMCAHYVLDQKASSIVLCGKQAEIAVIPDTTNRNKGIPSCWNCAFEYIEEENSAVLSELLIG